MENIPLDKIQGTLFPNAFVFYRPQTKVSKEEVFYNEEAWRILSLSVPAKKKGPTPPPDISDLCSRWKGLLEKKHDEQMGNTEGGSQGGGFIDVIQSHRRRYMVRGTVLSGEQSSIQTQEKQFLFTLERIRPDDLNLSRIFRQENLNRREQEIVQLLLADRSNKEIASALGLSLNTVKGYLKLLMRRLGASSRAGIIARLFTGK